MGQWCGKDHGAVKIMVRGYSGVKWDAHLPLGVGNKHARQACARLALMSPQPIKCLFQWIVVGGRMRFGTKMIKVFDGVGGVEGVFTRVT
jgi:hypothetical protein